MSISHITSDADVLDHAFDHHQLDSFDLLAHISLDGFDTAPYLQETVTFVDMLTDLNTISDSIDSADARVKAHRQQRRSGSKATAAKSTPRSRKASTSSERATAVRPAAKSRGKAVKPSSAKPSGGKAGGAKSTAVSSKRKKDDDALDCIYVELQDSANMCRYWGKKCWNLRVAKPKGGFHSLCHFHRARANDNQRRFDFKRRGTMWREFQPDPDAADISLFPAFPGESPDVFANIDAEQQSRPETVAKFEPFAQPVALQEQDVELLQELVGAATI